MADSMTTDAPTRRGRIAQRALGIAACALAAMFVLALARRPTTSVDLGYHLAYGEVFWQTGRIVDDDTFIAPPVTPDAFGQDAELPPGAWFDDDGRYRFPNANWLTQVILAGLYRLGGFTAMNLTMLALVALIMAGQAAIVHRLKIPRVALAPIWLALGVVGQERFLLRPELFAFACLTWQVWLLCGRISWPRVAAFTAVQLLAVNLHSYWLLGAGVAVAFAADAAARAAWAWWIAAARPLSAGLRGRLVCLAVLAAAMVPAAMVHPSGPSNAVFPFRTLGHLQAHDITGHPYHTGAPDADPWESINEFSDSFDPHWHGPTTWALAALLIGAAVAAALLLAHRRWAEAALLAAFALAGVSMRRNIIIPAILAGPLIALAVALTVAWWRRRAWPDRPVVVSGLVVTILTGVLACAGLVGVVTNRFYLAQRRPMHFGGGGSRLVLPLGPAAFLDASLPAAKPVYVNYGLSSSVLFFADRVTGVPMLTNTWSAPQRRMAEVLELGKGDLPLATLDAWGLDVAVLESIRQINRNLIARLEASDDWALVYLETSVCIFARRTEANAAIIARHEITPETFDVRGFIAACRQAGPVEPLALQIGASTLQVLGWYDPAVAVWDACLLDPYAAGHFAKAWLNRGTCLARRGRLRRQADPAAALADFRAAEQSFRRALEIRPNWGSARLNLGRVRQDIQGIARRLR